MSDEVKYDSSGEVEVIKGYQKSDVSEAPAVQDGLGCHSGSEMEKAAKLSDNNQILKQFEKDYPKGPHG